MGGQHVIVCEGVGWIPRVQEMLDLLLLSASLVTCACLIRQHD